MVTLSVIKADTGGYVGHCDVHPEMVAEARRRVADAVGDLLIDGQVATCGDDLSLIMSHRHGVGSTEVHAFAWATFVALTEIAKRLGLYGAGQDMLADAFSGNLRGMGPGYAEMEFTERPSEPILLFLADKTEPGAWNLPLFRMFADPFTTAGLVIDAKMHAGFTFEVYDLYEEKRLVFDCPAEMYDLLMFIGAPARYVVHSVHSKTLGRAGGGDQHPTTVADRRQVRRQGRPGADRALPVRAARGRRGPRTVRVAVLRGRLHARFAPRPADAGANPARPPVPLRRAAAGGVPGLPAPRRALRRAAGHVRRPGLRPGPERRPTRSWTTCGGTARSSRTDCP